jgi:ATP-dependent DNA ligase
VVTQSPVHLSPATTDPDVARTWFERFEGAGLDGIVAKRLDEPYRSGERTMVKVKHHRTCDCVVAGFRWHKDGVGIGSLLLGLYDDAGVLNHVGVCGSFTAKKRRELVEELAPLRRRPRRPSVEGMGRPDGAGHRGRRMPGSLSRWNAQKDLSWDPLRPERVCEVEFSHDQGPVPPTPFLRWRPDREPASCRYDQLEVAAPAELGDVLG